MNIRITCSSCGLEIPYQSGNWRCPRCSSTLKIDYVVSESGFRKEKLSGRSLTMWRYRELIPIRSENIISLGEGYTKIVKAGFLEEPHVNFKLDYLSPSGSFKDRGSSVAITHAKEIGAEAIVEDSSGNAGSSISLYSSAAGLKSRIYVPKDAPENKRDFMRLFGAEVMETQSREKAFQLAVSFLSEGEYYVGHLWNPFYIEGMKTMAFECVEQLNWSSPDYVITPVASGTLLLGLYKGFNEFMDLGLTDKVPVIIGVQAEGYAPIYESFTGVKMKWAGKSLLADALRVCNPPRLREIVDALRRSGGKMIVVNDGEILESLKIGFKKGFFIEPSSATAIAAYKRFLEEGFFRKGEKILIPLTGSGFKAMDKLRTLKLT